MSVITCWLLVLQDEGASRRFLRHRSITSCRICHVQMHLLHALGNVKEAWSCLSAALLSRKQRRMLFWSRLQPSRRQGRLNKHKFRLSAGLQPHHPQVQLALLWSATLLAYVNTTCQGALEIETLPQPDYIAYILQPKSFLLLQAEMQ